MSRVLVTGAAGFIGSHVCDALLAEGHEVVGLDAFIPYYPRALKESNLEVARSYDRFRFFELDLRKDDLRPVIEGCEVVIHEAAMPGLPLSWTDIDLYASCNITGTQRLLAAATTAGVRHFIHISTSSVYGREATGAEDSPLHPCSPYGITKLAAEHLGLAYAQSFGLPLTILRYFSVYGPRQRPDMAYHILIRCLLKDEPFVLYGVGDQTRSNTYIEDCVNATLLAMRHREAAVGEIFNVGGGEVIALNDAIALLEELTGKVLTIERKPARVGDQKHTAANIARIRERLGYQPRMSLREGLRKQLEWQTELLRRGLL